MGETDETDSLGSSTYGAIMIMSEKRRQEETTRQEALLRFPITTYLD